MVTRCTKPKSFDYKHYGGRGITVCAEWATFEGFWNDMSQGYSDLLTIDRIDNSKGYCKTNCRWASRKQQAMNRRSSHRITNPETGETRTLGEWAELYGLTRSTVNSRFWILGLRHFSNLFSVTRLPRDSRYNLERKVG